MDQPLWANGPFVRLSGLGYATGRSQRAVCWGGPCTRPRAPCPVDLPVYPAGVWVWSGSGVPNTTSSGARPFLELGQLVVEAEPLSDLGIVVRTGGWQLTEVNHGHAEGDDIQLELSGQGDGLVYCVDDSLTVSRALLHPEAEGDASQRAEYTDQGSDDLRVHGSDLDSGLKSSSPVWVVAVGEVSDGGGAGVDVALQGPEGPVPRLGFDHGDVFAGFGTGG